MPRDANTVNVHLRFSKAEHAKLVKLKAKRGMTWEEFILKLVEKEDE